MAEWLPVEFETPRKPEVLRIAQCLQVDPDSAFGKVFRAWCWFDQQTVDGVAIGVTPAMLDEILHSPGLATAMESVGWLQVHDDRIVMPDFRVHCGESAKKRHQAQRRKERQRARTETGQERDKCHARSVTEAPPDGDGEPETETGKITGPVRTGPGDFILEEWDELGPFVDRQVEPLPAGNLEHSVFKPLKFSSLQEPSRISKWFRQQLSATKPATGATEAERILVLAAARYAVRLNESEVKKTRVAVFVGIVSKRRWEVCRSHIGKAIEQWKKLDDSTTKNGRH